MTCKSEGCEREVRASGFCKTCYARNRYQTDWRQRERGKARNRAQSKTDGGKERQKWARIKYKTGWTREASNNAREAQNNRCAICPRWLTEGFCHDHKHVAPPKPRGLLCQACNLGLGYYELWQRPVGLVLEPYDRYLDRFSTLAFSATSSPASASLSTTAT